MDDPLRVLVVIKSLGPGGAERLVLDQLRHANAATTTYELFVCKPREPDLLGEAASLGVPVHLAYESRVPWPLQLRALLAARAFDVIHAHLPLAASGARVVAHTIRRRPRVMSTEHNRWPSYRWSTRVVNRVTLRLDDHSIAVSVDAADSMGFPARRPVPVISHGVDRPALLAASIDRDAVRRGLGLEATTVAVGTVANLRQAKNQISLLDAWAEADLGVDGVLFVVGQGPMRDELDAHADRLGLGDRVRFLGYRSDATDVMRAFDVFTLPSAHEGRPVALMEAMTVGLPVIVTDAGGMPDMVCHDHTGIVVPVGDVTALADQFRRVVGDAKLRERLGAAAADAAEAFDGSHAYAAIEAAYLQLASH